jgi:hypothetical protein
MTWVNHGSVPAKYGGETEPKSASERLDIGQNDEEWRARDPRGGRVPERRETQREQRT